MGILSSHSRDLITSYMADKDLPVIGFKSNSSMHDIVQSFFSASIGYNNDATEALESFESLHEYSFGQEAISELDQIAEKMANKINASLADIRNITAESESVLKQADELFTKMAAGDPVLAKFLNIQNEKIDRKELNWDRLNDYSSESTLVLSLNSTAGIQSPDDVDMDRVPYFANQLPYYNHTKNPAFTTIPESKEYTAFLGTIKSGEAEHIGKLLTNEREAKKFMAGMLMVLRPVQGSIYNMSIDVMDRYLDYMQAYGIIRDNVREELTGFGAKEYEAFEENMRIFSEYFDVMAYCMVAQRRTQYQEIFVLPNGWTNSDLMEEFKESGLSDIQLNNVVKYYTDVLGHIPSGGLTVTRIKQEMETVDKYINDRFSSAQFNADAKTKEYRARALNLILTDKIKEARGKNIRGYNEVQIQALLKQGLEHFITNVKTDFDTVSDFLMAINHPFTMSERLYKEFKKAYTSSLPDAGKITNTDLKMIETKVIAKTVAEFCKKAFC